MKKKEKTITMEQQYKKKALLPAVAMAMTSVIALTGISYAWFTMGNTASLDSLDVQVTTATGISVSMDAVDWKSTLTATEIMTDYSEGDDATYGDITNQFPADSILPVSTAGAVSDGEMAIFYGEVNGDDSLTSTSETAPDQYSDEGNYIAFDLFFDVAEKTELYLGSGSAVTYIDDENSNTTDDYGTQNSVRVAFVDLGCDTTTTQATTQALAGEGITQASFIWEPNATDHTDYAIANNSGISDKVVAYSGFNSEFSELPVSSLGEKVTSMDNLVRASAPISIDGSVVVADYITTLEVGFNKIRVYIWIEGQDVDCNNDISFGGISTTMNFVQGALEEVNW